MFFMCHWLLAIRAQRDQPSAISHRRSAIGYCLLPVGYCRLAIGGWLFAIDRRAEMPALQLTH
jgi:hypothetical protein